MAERTLSRSEFYKLAHECRDYAMRLANHDQNTVSREMCHEFNEFRLRVQSYDRLRQPLARLRPARPITRTMVLLPVLLAWLTIGLTIIWLTGRLSPFLLVSVGMMLAMTVLVMPPSLYGTTVEDLEGQVLVVTQALQAILESGEMEFTEAAYFAVRDVLRDAAAELRQQVYLNRVSGWRRNW